MLPCMDVPSLLVLNIALLMFIEDIDLIKQYLVNSPVPEFIPPPPPPTQEEVVLSEEYDELIFFWKRDESMHRLISFPKENEFIIIP